MISLWIMTQTETPSTSKLKNLHAKVLRDMDKWDLLALQQEFIIFTNSPRIWGVSYKPSFLMQLTLWMPLHPKGKQKQSLEKKECRLQQTTHKHDPTHTHTHTEQIDC